MIGSVEYMYRLMWQNFHVLPVLAGPILLAAGVRANQALPSPAALNWSPFHVRANVALAPIRTRWWPAYVAALATVIPVFALLEELIFRAPVHNLLTAILLGGLAFGFAHLTSLVSLRMCLYLTVVGWVFVGVYLLWGFWVVVLLHASYNLTALGAVAVERARTAS